MSDPCTRRRWMQMTGAVGATTLLSSVASAQTSAAAPSASATSMVPRRVKFESLKAGTTHAEADGNLVIDISSDGLVTSILFSSLVASASGWTPPVDTKDKPAVTKEKRKPRKVEPSCALAHLNVGWSNNADNTLVGFTIDVLGITALGMDATATLMLSFGGKTFMHEFAGPLSASQPADSRDAQSDAMNTEDFVLRFLVPAPFAKKETHCAWKLTAMVTAQGGGKADDSAMITIDSIHIEAAFKGYQPDPLPQGTTDPVPQSNSTSGATSTPS